MLVVKRLLPFLKWFHGFNGATLRADLVGGVTVALVLIPQSMAYAQLAGLPPYYGLYAAFLPPMVASLFGSSNQLATGPVAVVSLMTAATLEPLASAGSAEYVQYAILLAFVVGLFQLSLGVLRLGLIVNFLSHPVVNGFTNAAALIIATSQLSKVFGVYIDKASHHYGTIYRVIVAAVDFTHWPTVLMAALAFATMIGLKRINPRLPTVLVAVVVSTLLSWAIGFEKNVVASADQIELPEARETITRFNAAMAERTMIEQFRAAWNREIKEAGTDQTQGADVCTSCHGSRSFAAPLTPDGLDTPRSGKAYKLHLMPGLLDQRIGELKAQTSVLRKELRALRFQRARSERDAPRFYLSGELPSGAEATGGIWRLKVGQAALDPAGLTLMGGGAVVGQIPEGLPALKVPVLDWGVMGRLFVMAMIISLIGFMEAISIAKTIAARTHQWLDPNQELIGQGLGNIVGCMGQSYAVSGSFSRSAVNLQAGAQTGLSNVFSSAVVVVVLLFFTGGLYHLPQAVLAAIIMMAVIGLLNVKGFIHAWAAQRFDGLTLAVTFVTTLYFAPHLELGIAIGVALSLGAYLYRTMKPHVALQSLHSDGSLRDAARYNLSLCRHIAAIRFDGPLNFANTSYLEDTILECIANVPELRHVLIIGHGINEVDASGEEMLTRLTNRLRESGYKVSFSGLKDSVMDVLKRTHLYEAIGEEAICLTQVLALQRIHAGAHVGTTEERCPLLEVVVAKETKSA